MHLDLGLHLGQLEAGVLEAGDGGAEGLAGGDVLDGLFQRAARVAHGGDGQGQALARQLVDQVAEAVADTAEHGAGRHPHIVEEQLRSVGAVLADFFQVAAAFEAGQGGVHQEQGGALGAGLGVGLGGEHHDVGVLAVGDEGLGAIDEITAFAVRQGRGLHPLQIGAGARLGHGDGADGRAAGHLRQPVLLLLLGAQMQDVGRGDVRMHRQVGGKRQEAHAPGLFQHDHRELEAGAAAAVFLRQIHRQQAGLAHLVVELARHPAVLLPLLDVRLHLAGEEAPHVVAEQLQFGGVGGGEDGAGGCGGHRCSGSGCWVYIWEVQRITPAGRLRAHARCLRVVAARG